MEKLCQSRSNVIEGVGSAMAGHDAGFVPGRKPYLLSKVVQCFVCAL